MSSATAVAPRSRPRLERLVPLVGFVRRSDRASLRSDLTAGLTVAVMLVPQSMAYAALAGMPPVTGLYAAVPTGADVRRWRHPQSGSRR